MDSSSLFDLADYEGEVHPIVRMLISDEYEAERNVLLEWAQGFVDRDGKFANEFRSTFEASMWELYLFAFLKELSAEIDFSHDTPDFVARISEVDFCIEAVVARPRLEGQPPIGFESEDIPGDLNEFNRQSILRLTNSISYKNSRYRKRYQRLPHVSDKPFVIALASFDQPYAHLVSNRSIMAALYGVYFNEEEAISGRLGSIPNYEISAVLNNNGAYVDVSLFDRPEYKGVSAVMYSPVATWGKIRGLADSGAQSYYTTLHPNPDHIVPRIKRAHKKDYSEVLADGLYVLHNPHARMPLDPSVFRHPRIAQFYFGEGGVPIDESPEDFLLLRMVQSLKEKS